MKRSTRPIALLVAMTIAPLGWAAPEWYVGYSFIYSPAGNLCSFMRFQTKDYGIEQADILYGHLTDKLAAAVPEDASLDHTWPSESLAKGESGEQMAAAILANGLAACQVGGRPVNGILFIDAFGCEYQDNTQMCVRAYVHPGDKDATAFGIARGPDELGGLFVKRSIWDASANLVYAGRTDLPFALSTALDYAVSGLQIFSD